MAQKTGKVKFFNEAKGFGFIIQDEPSNGKEEIFVHAKNCASKNLKPEDKVKYDVIEGKKGPEAQNVVLA